MRTKAAPAAAAPAGFPDRNAPAGFPTAHGTHFTRAPTKGRYRAFGGSPSSWGEVPRSVLEIKLMEVLAALRDRAEWWIKAFDETIVGKWRAEATEQGIEPAMFELALEEARWQAKQHEANPAKPAAADGVYCRADLSDALRDKALKAVQRVRDRRPLGLQRSALGTVDAHPGSDGLVIDLVHPSLYAYEQGASLILPGGDAQTAPPWNSFIGTANATAEALPQPPINRFFVGPPKPRLAWLPAEFRVSKDGKSCAINSYVSGLHPIGDTDVYEALSECFLHAVPALESVLTELGQCPPKGEAPSHQRPLRVRVYRGQGGTWYSNWNEIAEYIGAINPGEPEHYYREFYWDKEYENDEDYEDDEEREEAYQEYWREKEATETACNEEREEIEQQMLEKFKEAKLILPQLPTTFVPPSVKPDFSLKDRPLQVISKIATIELTPKAPQYKGGTWHIEGMPDERIVATACVYLDAQNVTESSLQFRTPISPPHPLNWETENSDAIEDPNAPIETSAEWYTLKNDDESVHAVYGIGRGTSLVQPRGTSRTLPGRVLAWPNTLHHCVSPFELVDKTQPGHRTIVCFFLVDPTVRVRSSATVPPQAREWYEKEVRAVLLQTPLKALELRDHVVSFLGDLSGMITYAEAADRRLRLMEERTAVKKEPAPLRVPAMEVERVSFCEH